MISSAFFRPSASDEATLTRPVSSTSILAPVCSMMPRMVAPPLPIRSRILSVGIITVSMRRILRALGARPVKHGIHLVEEEEAATARLLHCLLQDLASEATDLDV